MLGSRRHGKSASGVLGAGRECVVSENEAQGATVDPQIPTKRRTARMSIMRRKCAQESSMARRTSEKKEVR